MSISSTKPSSDPATPPSEPGKTMEEIFEKYNPNTQAFDTFPMTEHRKMVRTMMLDNLLNATARLRRHAHVLLSTNDEYAKLQTLDRCDDLHADLMRYTEALRGYEYWKNCFIQDLELEPHALPPNYESYGWYLAVIECAKLHTTDPETLSLIDSISRSFNKSMLSWALSNTNHRSQREYGHIKKAWKKKLVERMAMATFAGLTLIVPMLIMVLDQRRLTTLVVTSSFTLGIGLILAWWMEEAENKDIIAATAAYAAVLVVFVGSGANTGV